MDPLAKSQSQHLQQRLVQGFDQIYVHLILQEESLEAFVTSVQITDDGWTEAFDHETLSAPDADGFMRFDRDG